jgi:hypothetical protein
MPLLHCGWQLPTPYGTNNSFILSFLEGLKGLRWVVDELESTEYGADGGEAAQSLGPKCQASLNIQKILIAWSAHRWVFRPSTDRLS